MWFLLVIMMQAGSDQINLQSIQPFTTEAACESARGLLAGGVRLEPKVNRQYVCHRKPGAK